MSRRLISQALVLALPLAAAGCVLPGRRFENPPPPPPAGYYVVINNTARIQTCAFRWPSLKWGKWFKIAPAANWTQAHDANEGLFQCRPPVRQMIYRLRPGYRYSLLPSQGGGFELVEVTAGEQ